MRVVLAGLAILSLVATACGDGNGDDLADLGEGEDADAVDDADADADLNILVESGGRQQQEAIVERFEEETGRTVNFVEAPYEGVFEQMTAELASGDGSFDVATLDVVWLPTFADSLVSLDELFTDEVVDDLFPALVEDADFDGTMLGMPQWTNAQVLLYRTDLFEDAEEQSQFDAEYGYQLAPPTDWDEFTDIANFFARDDLYGTDVKGAVEFEWTGHVLQAGSPGVVLDDDGQVIIDNDEHLAALEFYVGLHCEGQVGPSQPQQVGWPEAENQFYQGQTAMTQFFGHAYRLLPDDAPVHGDVGVAPGLAGPGGQGTIPAPWFNVIPETSENQAAAMEYIEFAFEHNELGMEAPLGLAARRSVYESYAGEDGYAHVQPLLDTLDAEVTRGRPMIGEWQQIVEEVLVPMLQEAVTCEADLEELLQDARDDVEALL